MIAGITEPLEFTFIFAAPSLWLVYSVLDGFFQMVTYIVGVRVCATNGILDFLVLNLPAGPGRTMWPLYVVIGLVEILVIFLVFRFMIEKMDLKTPGREEDETVTDLQENAASVKNEMKRRQKGSLNTASENKCSYRKRSYGSKEDGSRKARKVCNNTF